MNSRIGVPGKYQVHLIWRMAGHWLGFADSLVGLGLANGGPARFILLR
jgi:hypothetical protein